MVSEAALAAFKHSSALPSRLPTAVALHALISVSALPLPIPYVSVDKPRSDKQRVKLSPQHFLQGADAESITVPTMKDRNTNGKTSGQVVSCDSFYSRPLRSSQAASGASVPTQAERGPDPPAQRKRIRKEAGPKVSSAGSGCG